MFIPTPQKAWGSSFGRPYLGVPSGREGGGGGGGGVVPYYGIRPGNPGPYPPLHALLFPRFLLPAEGGPSKDLIPRSRFRFYDSVCKISFPRLRFQDSVSKIPFPRFRFQDSVSKIPFPSFCLFLDPFAKIPFPRFHFLDYVSKIPFPRFRFLDSVIF